MPNPCRQRSFWARIKLSKQNYCITFRWSFCSRIISCFLNSISIQFIYYDFKIYLRSQNLTGSSHYSIFKDHCPIFRSEPFIYHSLCFHQEAQRSHNLASFFRLSNHFWRFFKLFSPQLQNQLAGFKRMRWNIAPNFYLSNHFLKIFQIFSQSIVFNFIRPNQAKTWDAI